MKTSLQVLDYQLEVLLGWYPQERLQLQMINLSLELSFAALPVACQTDQLKDTVDYAQLVHKIENYCTHKEFALIEHLGWSIFKLVKTLIPETCQLKVRITKNHPLPKLAGSVFEIEDSI